MIRAIVAVDRKSGLAKHGFQPWYIPQDETYFGEQTRLYGGNILVGGTTFRNALHSRPLPDRHNYLLTHDRTPAEGVTSVHDLQPFLAEWQHDAKDLWVIGGAAVYKETLAVTAELYITHIDADFNCDQFFPAYDSEFALQTKSEVREQNGFNFYYAIYTRRGT